jgi:hypothetical protein
VAERLEVPAQVAPTPVMAQAPARARVFFGEQVVARVLRTGAIFSGMCFIASLFAEALPQSTHQAYAVDGLRRAGIALLVATPVVRLVAAGMLLALKGEWRYALYAACILLMLAVALGAGVTV